MNGVKEIFILLLMKGVNLMQIFDKPINWKKFKKKTKKWSSRSGQSYCLKHGIYFLFPYEPCRKCLEESKEKGGKK